MKSGAGARVRAILRKEWLDLRRNRAVVVALLFVPTLMTVGTSAMLFFASRLPAGRHHAARAGEIPPHLARYTHDPSEAAALALALVALMMFSILPLVLPTVMAAHSIVGEKTARSLEPLLSTPIRTWELLVGKIVAIVIPAIVPSLAGYTSYAIVAWHVARPVVFHLIVSPAFVMTVGVLGPLAAVFAVTFGIMISSRASDLQSAQGLSGIIVLPVIALGVGQLFGAVVVSPTSVLASALVLSVIDAGMVMLCVSVFERETILSRWK